MIDTPHNIATRKHRAKKRAWALEYLGGKCKRCGSTNNLEIDHINPSEKSFAVATQMGRSKEVLAPELDKCRLLCHACHMDVTILQRGQVRAEHGSCGMYSNWGCRCELCKEAWARYWRTKRWT